MPKLPTAADYGSRPGIPVQSQAPDTRAQSGALNELEAARGRGANAIARQGEAGQVDTAGPLVQGFDQFAQNLERAHKRIQSRQDAVYAADAITKANEGAATELRRITTEGDMSDPKTGRAYADFLTKLSSDTLENFQGSKAARAELEARITGIRGEYLGQAANMGLKAQQEKVIGFIDGQVNSLAKTAYENPGQINKAVETLDKTIGDMMPALTTQQERELRMKGRAQIAVTAVESLLDKGAIGSAKRTLMQTPGIDQFLPPAQLTALHQRIASAEKTKSDDNLKQQGHVAYLSYVLGRAPSIGEVLRYVAISAANDEKEARLGNIEAAIGGRLNDEQLARISSGGGEDITQGRTFQLSDGTVVASIFNKTAARYEYDTPEGRKPVPPAPYARPVSETVGAPVNADQFNKLEEDYFNEKQGLIRIVNYMKAQGGSDIAFERAVDEMVIGVKKWFGASLGTEQLSLEKAKTQLQAMLGANRVELMGPGPLTEPDAERLIQALGGKVDRWQSPQVVRAALESMYEAKYMRVLMKQRQYNRAAHSFPGAEPDTTSFPEFPRSNANEGLGTTLFGEPPADTSTATQGKFITGRVYRDPQTGARRRWTGLEWVKP